VKQLMAASSNAIYKERGVRISAETQMRWQGTSSNETQEADTEGLQEGEIKLTKDNSDLGC
jgi:hypothetical protein